MILNRQNPIGLKFTLSDFPVGVLDKQGFLSPGSRTRIHLVGTQKEIIVNQPLERITAMWYKWQMGGEMIQDAFKELSPEQREFLMTGITPHEWNEIFSEEEE